MTTEKQAEANKQNAQLSTGAITEEGKAIVARNAVKHGIFAKDLVIRDGHGKEDENEYKELLDNLTGTLHPSNQLEHLLVEKITTDFWRLKRVIRFETASVRDYIDHLVRDYYSGFMSGARTNEDLDKNIFDIRGNIQWNKKYLKCLKEGIVSFNKPEWDGGGVCSDIEQDLLLVCEELELDINNEDMTVDLLYNKMREQGVTDKDIQEALIKALEKQNREYEAEIVKIEQRKNKNNDADALNIRLGALPSTDNADKVMRYEAFLQKSITQNVILLRNLQGV